MKENPLPEESRRGEGTEHPAPSNPDGPAPPVRVEVTQQWLAELQRKRMAYEASRASWREVWFKGRLPESPLETEKTSRRRGTKRRPYLPRSPIQLQSKL